MINYENKKVKLITSLNGVRMIEISYFGAWTKNAEGIKQFHSHSHGHTLSDIILIKNYLDDVLTDVRRITNVCDLPLLVDIDTGFGTSAFNISRTVKEIEKVGASAVHMEDQVAAKRCGHRPNKEIVGVNEMVDRIKAAVDGRNSADFTIMARTDALANEGLAAALDRVRAYVAAGADMIFPEAVGDLETYKKFREAAGVPILANITEFGKTPLFTVAELRGAGVDIVLYPLSAFRAMNKAAELVYKTIRSEGTQKSALNHMQTREELYQAIDYYKYEAALDKFQSEKNG